MTVFGCSGGGGNALHSNSSGSKTPLSLTQHAADVVLGNASYYPLTDAVSNDDLSGWPASYATDGNPATSFSSNYFGSSTNDRGTFLAAWLPSGSENVNEILLTARVWDGAVLAFPQNYTIYLTAADNSSWISVGTFTNQPNSNGNLTIDLPQTYSTYGVLIVPNQLGVDNYGGHYFQLAEISLAYSPLNASLGGGFVLSAGNVAQIGSMQLAMQSDGNLVLYQNGTVLWATSFFPNYDVNGFGGPTEGMNCPGCFAAFQTDGNLVLYQSNGSPYWASGTSGYSGATLQVSQTAPYIGILDANNSVLWDPITEGFILYAGQSINIAGMTLEMQTDGNLVLYKNGVGLWATSFMQNNDVPGFSGPTQGMSCAGCFASFQYDGNLVLYDPGSNYNSYQAYWASNTSTPGGFLWLRSSSPYVSITNTGNQVLWSTLMDSSETISLNQRIDSGDPSLDYIIQDVCVDRSDHPIAGDPASCGSHRNLRIGEQLPYLSTDMDFDNGGARYQGNFSVPVPGADGTLKVMTTKSLSGNLNPAFQFSFDETVDGYDLIDVNGSYYSDIRTSDGGCYDQEWATNSRKRQNGWIFYAPGLGGGSLVHDILHAELSGNAPSSCTTRQGSGAEDVWNPPSTVGYESGKVLSSIVTYHYANENLSQENNALERYFFTREYGMTRWEAWIPYSRCMDPNFAGSPASQGNTAACNPSDPNNGLKGRCSPNNIPGTAVWGNQEWVRTDCRDTTFYLAITTPTMPIDSQMAQDDGLVDINSGLVFIGE